MLPDVILVAIDGNCKGYAQRKNDVFRCVKSEDPFFDRLVVAAPDPHIERWYLMDQAAFKQAVGLDRGVDRVPRKCIKDYYKKALSQALLQGGVQSLYGGAEFGEKIVQEIDDLDALSREDSGFGDFLVALRDAFRAWERRKAG